MLDILRKKSSTFGVYFVFAVLIVIFAVGFGGVGKGGGCKDNVPGAFKNRDLVEVDGEVIDAALVRTAMQLTGDPADPKRGFGEPNERFRYQTRFAYMNLYGPFSGAAYGVDPQLMSPVKLTKVVDELIETKLVAKWARDMGIGISKAELNDALALLLSNDSFRDSKTGALDLGAYRAWVVRSLETTVANFEKLVEEELLRERVIQLLVGEIGVSDAELEQAWKLENDKVSIEYISVDDRSATGLVPVTEAEVTEWLGKNEDKVKAEYDKVKDKRFTSPKMWKLRGIKVDAPDVTETDDAEQKKAYEEERKTAKAKADRILADVKTALAEKKVAEGADPASFDPIAAFATIASAESDDASKSAGGALPSLPLEELGAPPYGPAVKTATETMKPLEPTEVLEVPTGFWVFLPETIFEEKVEAYDAVKTALAKELLQAEKVKPFVKTLADEVLAEAKKDPTKKLADVVTAINTKYNAAGKGLSRGETSFGRLSRIAAGYPASIPFLLDLGGRSPELVNAAFQASADKPLLDKVFPVGESGRLVIARFVEKKAAEAMKDEDKNTLRTQLVAERRRAVYRGWYEDLLAKKRAAGDIEFKSAFEEERKAAEEAYVQAGGVLPGVTAPAPEPAPKP